MTGITPGCAIARAVGTGLRPLMGSVASATGGIRRAVALVVAGLLFLITPLAYVDLPDPLWIGGVWDDDDFDAAIAVVKSTEVLADSVELVFVPLEPCLYAPVPAPAWRPLPLLVRWPENRAPPDA